MNKLRGGLDRTKRIIPLQLKRARPKPQIPEDKITEHDEMPLPDPPKGGEGE